MAGVLKSDVAAKMSVEIARQFVQMRKFVLENKDTLVTLAKIQNRQIEFEIDTNKKFDAILEIINRSNIPKEAFFYAGQFYDAFEFVVSLIESANKRIILIDPYVDYRAFNYLKKVKHGLDVLICKGCNAKLTKADIKQFKAQYGPITIKTINNMHDRFLIVDDECYSLGASLNFYGKKTFAVTKIEDHSIIDKIVELAK